MSKLFWLTDAQMDRLEPFFTKSNGLRGVPSLKWSTNWDSMIPFQEDQRWLERETNPKMWC